MILTQVSLVMGPMLALGGHTDSYTGDISVVTLLSFFSTIPLGFQAIMAHGLDLEVGLNLKCERKKLE